MFTQFFYKKYCLPSELSDANKATRVAIPGILVRRSSKSDSFDSIFTGDVKWNRCDKKIRKRQWFDSSEAPKPTPKLCIHRNKVMLCVWWNSKGLVYFELLDSVPTVTAKSYQGELNRMDQTLSIKVWIWRRQNSSATTLRPHFPKITLKQILRIRLESSVATAKQPRFCSI